MYTPTAYVVELTDNLAITLRELSAVVDDQVFMDKLIALLLFSLIDDDRDMAYELIPDLISRRRGDDSECLIDNKKIKLNTVIYNSIIHLIDGFFMILVQEDNSWVEEISSSGVIRSVDDISVIPSNNYRYITIRV